MIQRIQSVYLAIAIVCMALLFIFPFSTYSGLEYNAMGYNNGLSVSSLYPLYINAAFSILLSVLAIFSFKKRKRQTILTRINFFVVLTLVAVMFWDFNSIEKATGSTKEDITYGVGMFLPIVTLITLLMANRFIAKDEKLIKSMDRIR